MKTNILIGVIILLGCCFYVNAQSGATNTNTTVTITGQNNGSTNSRSYFITPDPQRGWITTNNAAVGTLLSGTSSPKLQTITVSDSPGTAFGGFNVNFFSTNSSSLNNNILPAVTNTFTVNDSRVLSSVEVKVVVQDTWFQDNFITLKGPSGQTYVLYSGLFAISSSQVNGISNVRFTMNAKTPLISLSSPVFGSYLPDTALNNLNYPVGGTWKLIVGKRYFFSTAVLMNYSVDFKVSPESSGGFGFTF